MTWRVIQWATGNVGTASLRAVSRHPELELVGLRVHDPAKTGQDAGTLCGLDPLGVTASDDPEAILSLDADCVLHMPLPSARRGDPERDLADLCRILASGKNAITTVGYVYPKAYGPEVVERLEAACAEGGTSLHGTGVNPGFIGELLPLTLSGMASRIDRIDVIESTDFSFYPSRNVIVGLMGLGTRPAEFETEADRYVTWLSGLFRESITMIADGLALELEDVTTDLELAVAEETFTIAAGEIAAGTIAAQRFSWRGIAGGETRIHAEAVYRARADVAPAWPAPGCAVRFAGRPRMELVLDEAWLSNPLVATALRAVHAVDPVCRATPGIRTFLDLPLIAARHAVAV